MYIVNGASQTLFYGVDDKSTKSLLPDPEQIPTHLPHTFIFAADGPEFPLLVNGNGLTSVYGIDSFDARKEYTTHSSVLCGLLNAEGNAQMVQRVVPKDAKPASNVRLMIDVLETKVPVYQRMEDGTIKRDEFNVPLETGTTIDGFKVKFTAKPIALSGEGDDMFGQGAQEVGEQVDNVSGNQSVAYPILDLAYPSRGKVGSNVGFRIWAPTTKSPNPMNDSMLTEQKVFPFRMAAVRRADSNSSPKIIDTNFGEQFVNLAFKPKLIDKNTDSEYYVGDVFAQSYQKIQDPSGAPPKFGPFGRIHVYQTNIEGLLNSFYEVESQYIDAFSDFDGVSDNEFWAFNMLGGVTSLNTPYHSFQINSDNGAIRLSENQTIFMTGGSDGTMDLDTFDKLVAEAVGDYASETSSLLDGAYYPQSMIWDSGYGLETKYKLLDAQAIRKDIGVAVATHIVGGKKLSASEESSLAISLRTRAQLYPESEYFGTANYRTLIVGRSGILIDSQYKERLPLTLELAVKFARYMGAGNGRWKSGFAFDEAPQNQITMFKDINVTYTPVSVRNRDWANGLIWAENYSRRAAYFPAVKTIYNNDTSVLNSAINMALCIELQKVGDAARREFSGRTNLTNGQLAERVVKFCNDRLEGRFDGRFVIKPEVVFTEADLRRGYSWTLYLKAYMPSMKTVASLIIEAYRLDDLETQ